MGRSSAELRICEKADFVPDLHPVDATVIVLYLAGITAAGAWMGRRVKTTRDLFMPRRFGKAMMIMHAFGSGTATDQAVSVASGAFRSGLSGIWYQWLWLPSTPVYWLMAPIFRRFRATTTADVLELRFDRSVATLFAVVGIAGMSVKIGVMLKGAGALAQAGTGDSLPADVAIAVITVLFVAYGMIGGLGAAIVTDFVQGLLTILFSFLLLPFVLYEVGGVSGMRERVGDDFLSLVSPGEISVFFVVMFSLQALVGIVSFPHVMGACAAGKTEWEGRVGFVVGNLVKRVCTVAWCLTGIAAVAWYLGEGREPTAANADGVYGEMAATFLPAISPGLLGVFLASMLAAIMSSCDSFMISSSALFTENIYKPFFGSEDPRRRLLVGRVAGLGVVAGGLAFAYWTPDVIAALKTWFKIGPMTGIVLWISLVWRRMTVAGAWATTLAGFGSWWIATRSWFVQWAETLSFAEAIGLTATKGDRSVIYEPWVIVLYLSTAVIAGVGVSLVTRAVREEKLSRFYALIRTPVQPDEADVEPCTLPPGAETRPPLWRGWGFEIPRPSRTSVIGFAVIWLAIAALVGGVVWLVA